MFKLTIPHLSQPMELLSPSKKIWDKWVCTYCAPGNIALIVGTFEKSFKLKGLEDDIEEVYTSLYGFLTQLDFYQPFTLYMAINHATMRTLQYHYFSTLFNPLSIINYVLVGLLFPHLLKPSIFRRGCRILFPNLYHRRLLPFKIQFNFLCCLGIPR